MKIIEQYIHGKSGDDRCEDALVVTPDFIAVMDGSTSKSQLPPLPNGYRSGKMAAELVTGVIQAMPANTTLQQFVETVNRTFQIHYNQYYPADIVQDMLVQKENRWTCSAIIYSRHEQAIWMVGDCQALLIHANGSSLQLTNEKPYEQVLAQQRAAYLHTQLSSGKTTISEIRKHDSGRDQIIPTMLQEMKNQNVTYAVLDGFDIAWQGVKIIPHIQCAEIVLASDGYPLLFPTLQESENYLQQCLTEDPLMIDKHSATKAWMEGSVSFDDRAYIRFNPQILDIR